MTPFVCVPARRQPVDVMLALAWRKRFEAHALFEYGATLAAKVRRLSTTVFIDYEHKGQRFTLCAAPNTDEPYLLLYNGAPCTYRPETAAGLMCLRLPRVSTRERAFSYSRLSDSEITSSRRHRRA